MDCIKLLKTRKIDVYSYCLSGDMNGMPYYDEWVRDNAPPNRVALIDGQDQASTFEAPKYQQYCGRGHKVFTREMRAPFPHEFVSPRLGRLYQGREGSSFNSLKQKWG